MKSVPLKIISAFLCLLLLVPLLAACSRINADAESESVFESESEAEKVTETEKAVDVPLETETEEQTDTESETETETETDPETTKEVIHVDSLELDTYSVTIKVGESKMPLVTMKPDNADDKSELWSSSDPSVAKVNSWGNITGVSAGNCTVTVRSADNRELYKNVEVTVEKAPEPQTTSQENFSPPASSSPATPTYIGGILIANKTYALPSSYNPGVDPTAYAALSEMFSAASAEGISLWVASGFRSYSTQNTLYNNYVSQDGKAAADTYSARPGHSEHQTGLAFDLNYVADWFANTKEGQWLAANCWKYGFIIRYPAGKEWATGYKYEPWHVRYLGKDSAKAVYDSGLSLEEYLGITSQYNY